MNFSNYVMLRMNFKTRKKITSQLSFLERFTKKYINAIKITFERLKFIKRSVREEVVLA